MSASRVMKLLAVPVVAGVIALCAEGAASIAIMARSVGRAPAPGNFRQARYDSLLGWVGMPNLALTDNYGPNLTLTTNAEGMRMHRAIGQPLDSGETRAICSGDSFTFGSGVSDNETFCAYLEGMLPRLETVNMSQRGYGIDQAYLWYKRDAGRFPHQLHIFAFIWNDFERMSVTSFTGYPKPRLRLRNDSLSIENVPVPEWKTPGTAARVLSGFSNSRLIRLLQNRVRVSESDQMHQIDTQIFPIAEAVFRDLVRLNAERGSQLVLVYLPAFPDLAPGALDDRRARLAAFAKANSVALIDLTEEMRAVPQDSIDWMYITPNALPVDGASGHYTAMGHEWVARKMADRLRALPPFSTRQP